MRRLVSWMIDEAVPVKSGGDCGGVLNLGGAMAAVVSGFAGLRT